MTVYDASIAMRTSVTHRITAVVMYLLGSVVMTWFLLSIALGEEAYGVFTAFASSWPGTFILFGLSWCLFQHMASGIRHLVMDLGLGLGRQSGNKTGYATFAFSMLMNVAFWAFITLK